MDQWHNGNNGIRYSWVNLGQCNFLFLFFFKDSRPRLCKERRPVSMHHGGGCCGVLLPGRTGLLCVFTAVNCDVSEPSVSQTAGFSLFVPLNCLQYADVTEQLVGRIGSRSQTTQWGKSCQRWSWTGTNAAFLGPMTHAYVSNDYWISHSRGLSGNGTWCQS